jgi:hypothetical protein
MIEHAAVNDHPLVSVPSWSASWRIEMADSAASDGDW